MIILGTSALPSPGVRICRHITHGRRIIPVHEAVRCPRAARFVLLPDYQAPDLSWVCGLAADQNFPQSEQAGLRPRFCYR